MRIFVALSVPQPCRDMNASFARECAQIRRSGIKFVQKTNYHITLSFIGETDPARIHTVINALSDIETAPFTVALRGAGVFPEHGHKPHVLWTGIEKNEPLISLYIQIDNALSRSGIHKESRAFSPHLTIARMKPVEDPQLETFIASNAERDFGHFTASSFHLYRSDHSPSGPVYTPIQEFPQKGF